MPSAIGEQASPAVAAKGETIRRVNPLSDPTWDSKIAQQPGATFFHTTAWASVLNAAFGFEPCYFVIDHEADARSVLPMMEVDSWITGRRGVSLPFTDECAPLLRDESAFTKLFCYANNFGARRRWRHIELRGARPFLHGIQASTQFFGHELELCDKDLMANVVSSVRQAIRKAVRSGLEVESAGGTGPIADFYALMCKTRRRHGMPPQPFCFFKAINEHIISQGRGLLLLARHHGRAVAGAIFFINGRRAIFKFGASDAEFQEMRPNNLIMWEAISRLARGGFQALDMGRTSVSNGGLRRFKLSWGARERAIDYFRFDLRHNSFVSTRDLSSGSHCRIFSKLPIALSKVIGAAIYRHAA